ncbi:MAG: hypothetical protein LC687_07110, partial [Actinobacteria bacterium]|nr:hypothetical protein [Actinomycetota bacterium]
GQEPGQAYSYMTGEGDDVVDLELSGDALDYAGSSIDVSTGAGKDKIDIFFGAGADNSGKKNPGNPSDLGDQDNEQLNQVILDSVTVDGGADDDNITVDGVGNANIHGGDGNDVIKTAGSAAPLIVEGRGQESEVTIPADTAVWAFNFDPERVDDATVAPPPVLGPREFSIIPLDELPGVGTDLAFLAGATITVTLSGAGINSLAAGGGVMALSNLDGDAVQGSNGYEASFTIDDLINDNDFYGDQRDVNEAVIAAIEGDAVLSELLTAELGPADAYYDGLSVEGDGNSTTTSVGEGESNLHTIGSPSNAETDNTINGGNGDDLIVLSTDGIGGPFGVPDFETNFGTNNRFLNGASNETIEMTGDDFGNDTIMNFTTAGLEEREVPFATFNVRDDAKVVPDSPEQDGVTTVVIISDVLSSGDPLEVTLTTGADNEQIAAEIVAAVNDNSDLFTAEAVDDGGQIDQIEFTGIFPSGSEAYDEEDLGFVIEDRDENGDEVETFQESVFGEGGSSVSSDDTTTVEFKAAPGLDFLDFTDYLTSLEDTSNGSNDSSASNAPIEVTLDYNENNTPGGSGDGSGNSDVEANEVAVVRMAGDATDNETFSGLSASVIEDLFNNDGTFTGFGSDSSFGNLDADDFDVADYNKDDQEALIGDGKAIFMVENDANLGEYAVFELTWDGDEDLDEQDVSVQQLGSLDFGTSLTDLDDVNLVGSSEYAGLDLTDPTTWGL